MAPRRHVFVLLAAVLASTGAAYPTQNFVVEAPTPELAQQFGQAAEQYRREKAIQWLGYEMPAWPERCPVHIKVTMGGAGGATQFSFDRGRVLGQYMNIEGTYDRLLVSVLPHEVTHTVFAYYFRCPVPRWADEGGAVLSEDDVEKNRHDMLCRHILNTPGRAIPLRRLFGLTHYPGDVMALYAQGFSVSEFLVGLSNRPTFLKFVAHGMQWGWDSAAVSYYHYRTVEELEQAWLTHLRETRRQPTQVAQNSTAGGALAPAQVVVRQTVPPVQPLPAMPVYRGQAPSEPGDYDRTNVSGRPGYLPEPDPTTAAAPRYNGPPSPGGPDRPPTIRLGPPQSVAPTRAAPPAGASPVGYPDR